MNDDEIKNINKILSDVHNGKEVICPKCGEGTFECKGDPLKSKYFKCTKCDCFITG